MNIIEGLSHVKRLDIYCGCVFVEG